MKKTKENLSYLEGKKVIVTQTGSTIGSTKLQAENIKGLGLRKIGSQRELVATKSVLGMMDKVHHLIKIEVLN